MLMTSGGFFPVAGMLVIHHISSLCLGLIKHHYHPCHFMYEMNDYKSCKKHSLAQDKLKLSN